MIGETNPAMDNLEEQLGSLSTEELERLRRMTEERLQNDSCVKLGSNGTVFDMYRALDSLVNRGYGGYKLVAAQIYDNSIGSLILEPTTHLYLDHNEKTCRQENEA